MKQMKEGGKKVCQSVVQVSLRFYTSLKTHVNLCVFDRKTERKRRKCTKRNVKVYHMKETASIHSYQHSFRAKDRVLIHYHYRID